MTFESSLLFPVYCLLSFIIGSVPTGLLIAKTKGIDLRKVGSGNIGATNVLRAMGKEAALLTLAGDMLKGALPIIIFRSVAGGLSGGNQLYAGLFGIFAVLGHNFSIFLKFRGGKGVATSFGVLFAYSPHVGLLTATFWLLSARWTKYSSLSALVAFGLLPVSFFLLDNSKEKIMVAFVLAGLIFIRHASNIKRLVQGTETRIGQKG